MLARTNETDTADVEIAVTMQSLTMAAGKLFHLSNEADSRDKMIDYLGNLSEIALAINLVWSRVKAREEA
jgi:hypothetical protein